MKLIAALAAWYDLQQLATLVIIASCVSLPFCIIRYTKLKSFQHILIPYGTFLSLSALAGFFIYHNTVLVQ